MQQGIRRHSSERDLFGAEKPETHLVIDGNSLFKRCFSVDKRVSGNGLEWGAVFQFLLQVKIMLHQYNFDYVNAFFDGEQSGYLRYKFYKDYKSNRVDKNYASVNLESEHDKIFNDYCKRTMLYHNKAKAKSDVVTNEEDEHTNFNRQLDLLCTILEELFIRNARFDMVEGDDLVAYYVKNKKAQDKIVIMTGDMDLTQLISDTVIVYNLSGGKNKYFITSKNSVEKLGFTHKNVRLVKTICGDKSDNIYPVTGFGGDGHLTLFKLFPELVKEEHDIDYVMNRALELNSAKKTKFLENLIEHKTTGSYDGDILEINNRLVDLTEPLLTDEAREYMDAMMYAPIDPDGRDFKNIKQIAIDYKLTDWLDDGSFGRFFSDFTKTIDFEKKRFKKLNM